MNLPECVLTGCDFYDPVQIQWVRGDLHRIGDCYILTANTTESHNCNWQFGPSRPGEMVVSAMQAAYFERRGVIVFTKDVAVFNDHAEMYLRPKMRHNEHLKPVQPPWPFPTREQA